MYSMKTASFNVDKSMLLSLFSILLNKLQKLYIDIWGIHSNLK